MIKQATHLYADEPFGTELKQAAYALDSTTIDLCLSLFPWAKFRQHKAAIKLNTLLALRGNFLTVIILATGKVHDVNILDLLAYEPGSFYIADRGYLDFARLYRCRWQVELFFKWIKQHLRIKVFHGTSENAVRIQVWVAISVYVLIAIVTKRFFLSASLYTILQILSLSLFEKTPILQVLLHQSPPPLMPDNHNQPGLPGL